jgi:hypothetical protein
MKKFCRECLSRSWFSTVYLMGTSTTLLGSSHRRFWDEYGNEHYHDPNIVTKTYSCTKDHWWAEEEKVSCPTCDIKED